MGTILNCLILILQLHPFRDALSVSNEDKDDLRSCFRIHQVVNPRYQLSVRLLVTCITQWFLTGRHFVNKVFLQHLRDRNSLRLQGMAWLLAG